jgi:maleate isomerase
VAAAFIAQSGFNVVAQQALGLVRNLDIGLLDPASGEELARRVDRPEAEAVMLACGNWDVFPVIEPLERALGKPVLTTNQVSLWHALSIVGAAPLGGLGVLLRAHLGEGARGAASAA